MSRILISILSLGLLAGPTPSPVEPCVGLDWPVTGQIISQYQPVGRFAGHWGIDIEAESDTGVRSASAGRVTFAGQVVDNLTVTVDHGGGLKTSYSYLQARSVGTGTWVDTGTVIGRSGSAHGIDSLHFSVRLDGNYVDPLDWLGCHRYEPGLGLHLVG